MTAPAARSPYRGRFAPSPTGPLHFGSLVAALASYCDARAAGGEWLVRIEDVDEPRSRPEVSADILRTLERYGFAWDGPVLVQSARTEHYDAALARLRAQGDVYPCGCTRRDLATAALSAHGERIYPGTCREGRDPRRVHATPAWRMRVAEAGVISFTDRLQGWQAQDLAREVGDFVVKRADGPYAYQLAVVVDDALQDITTVVRGSDLLPSTARQIHLQHRLGYPTPEYLHVPVAINAQGEKLSKQTLARPLAAEPLPALRAAWRFLGQELPGEANAPASVAAFWDVARATWKRHRLPPTLMLPAPPS